MINAFAKVSSLETLHDGLLVVRLLMVPISLRNWSAVRFTDDGFDDNSTGQQDRHQGNWLKGL